MKMNSNQFTTIKNRYPFETVEKIYSDSERERFIIEAKNWRLIRLQGKTGTFKGNFVKLFKTAEIKPDDIYNIPTDDFLIEDGELVGVKVTCGYFDINGGMGGWRGSAIPLYFNEYKEIVEHREKYRYLKSTSSESEDYYSIILPIEIINSLPEFIIENHKLVCYLGNSEHIEIPEGVVTVGYKAFCGCRFIKTVTFPKSLRVIESFAFSSTLIKRIDTNVPIEIVESHAFSECRNLISANFNSSTKVSDSAFMWTPLAEPQDDSYEVISPEEYYHDKN